MPGSFSQSGFIDRIVRLRGFENLRMGFLDQPPQLPRLIDLLLDDNVGYLKPWLEIGVDVFLHHGDIRSQKGLIFSPQIFRQFLKSADKALFRIARAAGTHLWYSPDGNLLEIVDDLAECGVSMHDPQAGAATLDGSQRRSLGRRCALGDLDEQRLPFCSPPEINEQTREVVEKPATPTGGLKIFAIHRHDIRLENTEAVLVGWEQHCFHHWP